MRVLCGRARTPLTWGCSACGRDDTSPIKDLPEAARRAARGCDGKPNEALMIEGHPSLRVCPWTQISDAEVLDVERWARWKRLGVFPFSGAGSEQPADMLERLEICEHEALLIANEEPPPKAPASKKR